MANTELVELNEPRKMAPLGKRVVPRRRHEHHELAPAKARSAVKNFGVNHAVNIGCYSSLHQLPQHFEGTSPRLGCRVVAASRCACSTYFCTCAAPIFQSWNPTSGYSMSPMLASVTLRSPLWFSLWFRT